MPKYEFIGTKGNSTGEYHLYRDETGKVIEVPAEVAGNSPAKRDAENKAHSDKGYEYRRNVQRAAAREGKPHAWYPTLDELREMPPQRQQMYYGIQDAEQRPMNERNIKALEAYKSQVLTANPSAGGGPTAPGSMAPVPPAEPLVPQPVAPMRMAGMPHTLNERAERRDQLGRHTPSEREALQKLLLLKAR